MIRLTERRSLLQISFNKSIDYPDVNFVEKALASLAQENNPAATILLSSVGGSWAAAAGLHHFIKSLPYPVRIHVEGACASAAVAILLAGTERTCSVDAQFMLHGLQLVSGGMSPSNTMQRSFYASLGWASADIDHYFSSADEIWFDYQEAMRLGLVQAARPFQFASNASILVVPI